MILIEKYTLSCQPNEFDFVIATYKHETFEDIPSKKKLLAKRTINTDVIEKLLQLPADSYCYIANNTYEATLESLEMLQGFGIRLKMLPYPKDEVDIDQNITTVVTHDVKLINAKRFKNIIEIGMRPLDFSAIIDMAVHLQLPINTHRVYKATNMDEIVRLNINLSQSINQIRNVYQQVDAIINATQEGIVTINSHNIIIQVNKALLGFLKKESNPSSIVGKNFSDIFPSLDIYHNKEPLFFNINQFRLIVQPISITLLDGEQGMIIVFREIKNIQQTEMAIRKKIHTPGFVSKYQFTDLIGHSHLLKETIEKAKKLGQFDQPVLISGENGTGKEIFAHSLHHVSNRRNQPFVPINFAGLPESLAESELFGYEDGAFTGAKKGGKPGFFELAHNGTIFLDEIGDAPPSIQASLLRVLQEKQILRVGGTQLIPVNVRIIAATNKDLFKLVEEGRFREDLYYRLNVLPLQIPPLRERKEDILPLVEYFFSKQTPKAIFLSKEVKEYLLSYSWPGNIRELENTVYYLSAIIRDDTVEVHDLPNKFLNPMQKGQDSIVTHLESEGSLSEFKWILSYLQFAKENNLKTGRNAIEEYFKNEQIPSLSAQQIKSRMSILKKYHLVEIGTTRQGSWITSLGLETLNALSNYRLN
ncbi:sigma 54-interacting transcriptional regulator [Bacillus sp. FJAT-49736]|uniref:sigma-54 interaction domain-containing protein n=1 Tax=Bacillus sp. FJAT-49736 TaxID=2833582 RepID=UPI001BC9998A|nr:sigma 54-interacting transcriptional regulator [Bacillus sp. FJAT-49736]MBS4174106.1 sigma 54-interacting transcriptional regulator [Bacillus sp. FJAT-49736]